MRILDVGCGAHKTLGSVGIDERALPGVDVVCSLEAKRWPFRDSSFDQVVFNDSLEHIDNVIQAMRETHRICKHGARVKILTPHFSHPYAFRDPTHRHFFTYQTIDYFTGAMPNLQYSEANFKLIERKFVFTGKGGGISQWVATHVHHKKYEKYLCRLFPAEKLYWEVEVLKA